jgi:hypothetical protein
MKRGLTAKTVANERDLAGQDKAPPKAVVLRFVPWHAAWAATIT